MTTKLTTEQRDDLQQHGYRPVPVVDPDSNAVYFLVARELFQEIFGDESTDARVAADAQSIVAGAAGWDDPEMDVYDDYDAHRANIEPRYELSAW